MRIDGFEPCASHLSRAHRLVSRSVSLFARSRFICSHPPPPPSSTVISILLSDIAPQFCSYNGRPCGRDPTSTIFIQGHGLLASRIEPWLIDQRCSSQDGHSQPFRSSSHTCARSTLARLRTWICGCPHHHRSGGRAAFHAPLAPLHPLRIPSPRTTRSQST